VLRQFMLRRLLGDVNVVLPLRIDISLSCPMTQLQRKVYVSALQRNWAFLKGGASSSKLSSVMTNLRKAKKRNKTKKKQKEKKIFFVWELGDCSSVFV
jgi:SNF2 family DNA or RNA helicase